MGKMKDRSTHNTVDVKVGAFMRKWIVGTYGTDCIELDRSSNIWMIIKQNLELTPEDYQPVEDWSEHISFILLRDGSNTVMYRQPTVKNPKKYLRLNTLYRCSLSSKGENIIVRFLENQFRNTFHNYMRGALNNGTGMSIADAITEFLNDSRIEFDAKLLSRLTKDWYRFRLKNPDCFSVPIFF